MADTPHDQAPLGVGVVVRTNREISIGPKIAGEVGIIIGQARNGPNRYKVLFPGDPFAYSLAAKDMTVVRGLDRQAWWKKPSALPVPGDTSDTTGGEIRCTPGSALTGERVRVHCWTEADGDWTEDGVVTASRPAGRNFVDVLLDDGRTRHDAHNYEVLAPDPVVARDEADWARADTLRPDPT